MQSCTIRWVQIILCLIFTIYNFTTHISQVKDCVSAVANVDDYGGSARLLAATTLRNVLGTKTLGDILSDRESIARCEIKSYEDF